MGRYDFRPSRVLQTAQMLLKTPRMSQPPPWFQVIHDIPPSEILVRTQPVQHVEPARKGRKIRKPSRMFQPQRIGYEEDALRQEFFADHPWELARPRMMLEDDGKDYQRWDWSLAEQAGRPRSGESVIQRQAWLMRNQNYTKERAYDKARKEHYAEQHNQEIETRIAKEEALSLGATFGKSAIEVGMQLESAEFDRWRVWAEEQVVLMEQQRSAAYTGLGTAEASGELDAPNEGEGDNNTLNAAAELIGDSIPNSKTGQLARGGSAIRP